LEGEAVPKRVAPLNAKQVYSIKSGQELIDGAVPGLRVTLTAAGLSWGLSVRVKAERRWIAVGVGIGLAEARKRAARLRQDIVDGRDPAAERQETWTRAKNASEGLGTLESALRLYFDHRPELRSARTQAKALMPVFREYLAAPALDLTPALGQLAIDKWARERSATLAARAVTYFKPFARWAGRRGLMAAGFSELERPAQAQKKQPTLSTVDLTDLLQSLSDTPRGNAVRTMLMTGARCNEVAQATWSEFDLEQGSWTLPGRRRKNVKPGRLMPDHVMPLSGQLIAMLKRVRAASASASGRASHEDDAIVFPGPRGAVLGDWPKWTRTVRARLGLSVRPHDLRRTFATLLGELGAAPHVVSAALGHTIGDQLTAGYNKAAYSTEVRAAIDRLADRLAVLEMGGNIVTLPRRA
jgi:integrase